MHVYAVDGKKVYIPRSESLEKKGFQGKVLSDYRDSYQLVMYITHAYDVLSGTTKDLMASGFEKNSITLYDRLYLCLFLLDAHKKAENYFIMRCKTGSALKEIVEFANSKEKKASFKYEGMKLYLVKKNKKTGRKYFYNKSQPIKIFCKRH